MEDVMNKVTGGTGGFGWTATGGITLAGTDITATAAELNLCDLSAVGVARKWKAIAVSGAGVKTSEMDTGWAIPAKCVVHDVMLNVTTASTSSGTITVGLLATTSGDADGFLVSVPTSAAGMLQGKISCDTSGLVKSYWGALLCTQSTATGAAIILSSKNDAVFDANTSSKNISYTLSSSSACASLVGNILVSYSEVA